MSEETKIMYKCDICGDREFDTPQKLGAHKRFCAKKQETDIEREKEITRLQKEYEDGLAADAAETDEDTSETEPTLSPTKKAEVARKDASRRKRIPLGTPVSKLSFDVPPGKVGRTINDTPGRIERAKRGGWELVKNRDGGKMGEDDGNSDLGSAVSRIVDRYGENGPVRGYQMVIDKEFYDEDQRAKQREIDKTMDAIKDNELNEKPDDRRYVPKEGIQIRRETG